MTLAPEQATTQPPVESSDAVGSLIDSYMKRNEQLVSLLHDIQNRFNYLPHDVLTNVQQVAPYDPGVITSDGTQRRSSEVG